MIGAGRQTGCIENSTGLDELRGATVLDLHIYRTALQESRCAARARSNRIDQAKLSHTGRGSRADRNEEPEQLTIRQSTRIHPRNQASQAARLQKSCVKNLACDPNLCPWGYVDVQRGVPSQIELHSADCLARGRENER